jgi:phosphatidate cytidylyltransferase
MTTETTSPGRWRDLGVRGLSAAVLIPAVLVDVWLGEWWFVAFVAVLMVLCAREYVRMSAGASRLQLGLHAAGAIAGAVLPVTAGVAVGVAVIASLWICSGLAFLLQRRGDDAFALLGLGYVSIPALALVELRADPQAGLVSIYWLFCVIWMADTCAYFAGRLIGGPKLWPAVSPKKTWAGLYGAMVGAVLASVAVTLVAGLSFSVSLLIMAAILAVVEQGGDLYESALKRKAGVKDSGTLIPGHGGALDRVDGLLAAATAAWALNMIGLLNW